MRLIKTLLLSLVVTAMLIVTTRPAHPSQSEAWEDIQTEFARQALVFHLRILGEGTWAEIEEYFTFEMREALALRTNREIESEAPIADLLVRDALHTLREQHRLSPTATWSDAIDAELDSIRSFEPSLLPFFRVRRLAENLELFWRERARQLFPLESVSPLPPQWVVSGAEGFEI